MNGECGRDPDQLKDSQWKACLLLNDEKRTYGQQDFFNHQSKISTTKLVLVSILLHNDNSPFVLQEVWTNIYTLNYGHPAVQNVLLQSFGYNSNPYTILIQTIALQAFLIFVSFFLSFFLVFSFKDSCTTFTAKKQKCLLIHTWENETFQGVEFTEISCGRGELVWSKCDGMTSCCKALRATVSCANDGRKFGSLGINRQEEQPIKLDLFSKGVVINCV